MHLWFWYIYTHTRLYIYVLCIYISISGLTGALGSWTRGSAESCTWGGASPCLWGEPSWKATLQKRAEGSCWDTRVNMNQQFVLAIRKGNVILGCFRRSIGSKLRQVIFPFYSALVWSSGSSFGLAHIRENHMEHTYWRESSEAAQRWQKTGISFLWVKDERAGTDKCGGKKAQSEDLISVYEIPEEKVGPGSFQKQWPQTETQEDPCECQETLFTVKMTKQTQVSQRGCSISILGVTQKLPGHSPEQPAACVPS